jgi:hypothetical protein
VAEAAGVSESVVSRWRSSDRDPRPARPALFVAFVNLSGGSGVDVTPPFPSTDELVVSMYLQAVNDARGRVRRDRSAADPVVDTERFFRLQAVSADPDWYRALHSRRAELVRPLAAEIGRRARAAAHPIRHRHPDYLADAPPPTAETLVALVREWRESWNLLARCVPGFREFPDR